MGEVYRARDTRLARDVAVKALPDEFARDPDRLARFEREAKLLASLTHANIAGIFGLEEVGGHRYLVLELVEGETLAQRDRRAAFDRRSFANLDADCSGTRKRARKRDRAPRFEAGQHHDHARGRREGAGLRTCEGGHGHGVGPGPVAFADVDAWSAHWCRYHLGHGGLHESGASAGPPIDKRTDIWSFGACCTRASGPASICGDTVSDMIARSWNASPIGTRCPRTPARIRELLRVVWRKTPSVACATSATRVSTSRLEATPSA